VVKTLPVLFAIYWLSVLAWSLLSQRLLAALRDRHPLTYGGLALRPAPAAGPLGAEIALLRFLIAKRDRFLEDRRLGALCALMRMFLGGYLAFFILLPGLLR
jgi:hypothetical protein